MASVIKNPDGTYTVTVTNIEQQIIAGKATREGVSHAAVVDGIVTRTLRGWLQQWRERTATSRQDAYEAASPSTRTTVDAALNFTPPEV